MSAYRIVAPWFLAAATVAMLSACARTAQPAKWTLWYIPGEERVATTTSGCHTFVFGTPDQSNFAVAVMKGWSGTNPPSGPQAQIYTGENFSGDLELGAQNVQDTSNGHNANLDVIYRVDTYEPAKMRADSLCNVAGHAKTSSRAAHRPVPAPHSTSVAGRATRSPQ